MRSAGSVGIALIAATPFVNTADAAQRAQRKAPPAPPPQFHVTEATRPMALDRANVTVGASDLIGRYGDFLVCRPELPVYGRKAFADLRTQDLAENFNNEASTAGYRMAGAASGDLFRSSDTTAPQILVGAVVQSMKVSGCHKNIILQVGDGNAEGTITVEWQVFDPLEKKVLFKATTTGTGKASAPVNLITVQVARAAFQQAAKAVLAMPEFAAAVRDPNGKPPSEQNALFPEAEAAKAPSAGPTQIPHVALSTTPFPQQVEALRKQVVSIKTSGRLGSGYYITDTLLLTNEHVIRGFTTFRAKFSDGHEIPGEVLARDAKRDIALLKTESIGWPGLPLRLQPPALSTTVYVIGSPLDEALQGSVTSGIISAFRDFAPSPTGITGKYIQSDVAVTHGNSGGPMFDEFGNVIGMTDLGLAEGAGLNLFIPIADGLKVLNVDIAPDVATSAATNATR